MQTIPLDAFDLALAALLVLALALLSWRLRLGVGGSVLVAALRTTIQLLLVGLVLEALFDAVHPLWMALVALVMLGVAAREVHARQRWRWKGGWGPALGGLSMFVSAFTLTVFALVVVVQPAPWYEPRYAVPLLGMMTGNTMNGIALGLNHLSQSARDRRARIEAQLVLGVHARDAIADVRREAMRTGLIPMINTMAAAGLVSLPGMMTGQILAGNEPTSAVLYQILILFLIASGTGFGVMAAVTAGSRRLFDARERLRLDRLSDSRSGRGS